MSINFRSVGKAFKDVGLAAASVGTVAGLTFLNNPETLAPIAVAFGPFGVFAAPLLLFGVRYVLDAYKHRNAPVE